MNNAAVEPDCSQCAALCCVAFAFDADQGFGYDKPAGVGCRHLNSDNSCAIHTNRSEHKMISCGTYTCNGAGQYVTQALFDGKSWQDDPSLLGQMSQAFLEMVRIQDSLALLIQAETLPLDLKTRARLAELIAELVPPEGWSLDDLATGPSRALGPRIKAFLRGLQELPITG